MTKALTEKDKLENTPKTKPYVTSKSSIYNLDPSSLKEILIKLTFLSRNRLKESKNLERHRRRTSGKAIA
jgi:hypothetical protein